MPRSSSKLKPNSKRSVAKPKRSVVKSKPKPKQSVVKSKTKRPAAKPKRPDAKPKPKRSASKPTYSPQQKPTYVTKQEPTYVAKQEPTYVAKQEPTYVAKQEPTYVAKQEPTYVAKQEPIKEENKTIFPPKEDDGIPDKEGDVIFGGNGIASLSGPVSFYYLRPKKPVYEDGNEKYFPLIVLFGDFHRSLEYTCNQCVCSIDRKKGCCYTLSDPEFLKKLDTLASDRHPVDFYTETNTTGTNKGFKGGVMENLTTGEMVSCYRHRLRGTEKDKCPTKNIRWQAGETRFKADISSYDDDGKTYHSYAGGDSFVKDLIGGEDITKLEKKMWIEQQLHLIRTLFYEFMKNEENREWYAKTITDVLRDSVFKSVEGYQELLLTLCENDTEHDDNTLNLNKFANAFFRLLTKENSLIYKQIEKQSYQPFRDIEQWIDLYERSLTFSLKNKLGTLKRLQKRELRETIKILSSIVSDPTILATQSMESSSEDLSSLLDLSTPLLDIYTIARIWKQPTGGNRSSLSFGYFGNYHVENIVDLLLSTNAYELVFSKQEVEGSRCQVFDFKLNLSKELRRHNQFIDVYGPEPKKERVIGPGVYLRGENFKDADLSGADLSGSDLSGANLSGANLSGANLSEANLSKANFSGANLSKANFSKANLSKANLTWTNLSGTNLSKVDLSEANLSKANFSKANLSKANLTGTNLSYADLTDSDLSGATLSGTTLSGATLEGANLSGTNLSNDTLKGVSNLRRVNLSGTDLSGSEFQNVDLSGANLSGANLSWGGFENIDLSGANLSGANLSNVVFFDTDLSNTNLSDANLSNATIENCDLSESDLSNTNRSGAKLKNVKLTGVKLTGAKHDGANL